MRGAGRGAAAVGAAALIALSCAPAAQAHAVPESFSPARNARLDTAPTTISVTFNEVLNEGREALTVTGPGSSTDHWNTGSATIRGAILSTAVAPLGAAGEYRIHYRVTSADGHVVNGDSTFTLTRAGGGTPVAQVPTATGIPVWPFVIGGVLVLAGAVAVIVVRTRRSGG